MNQNVWNFLRQQNIFFNVKSGCYQGNLNGLILNFQKDQEIKLLKDTIKGLQSLITEQIEKIKDKINNYLRDYPFQKHLLKKYVSLYVELKKAEKKKIANIDELDDLENEVDEIYSKLKNNLGKERKYII
jgi:DNA repair ATPase RecN